jgi:hypothetical protein
MMQWKPAENIGQVQIHMEAALEHVSQCWGVLRRAGLDPLPNAAITSLTGRRPATMDYHLAAVEMYIRSALHGSYEFAGKTDGQLCPNPDCAHDLAFDGTGWHRCPICLRPFYATESDSDIEDFHTRKPKRDETPPANIPMARDLGSSWATP